MEMRSFPISNGMDLQVQKREKFGKDTEALRASGFVPAELYGRGVENIHLSVSAKDFSKVFKEAGESTVVNVIVEGVKHPTLIYDVQYDPVLDTVLHADFYEVRMDEKIKARIPVEFIGEPSAIKEKSGILVRALHEIEVEALPGDLPHHLEVDVSTLDDIGKSFYVKDLKTLPGVDFLIDTETVVATITAQMTLEEEAAMAGPANVEEVKVETEEEKAARDAVKAETGGEAEKAAPAPDKSKNE